MSGKISTIRVALRNPNKGIFILIARPPRKGNIPEILKFYFNMGDNVQKST